LLQTLALAWGESPASDRQADLVRGGAFLVEVSCSAPETTSKSLHVPGTDCSHPLIWLNCQRWQSL